MKRIDAASAVLLALCLWALLWRLGSAPAMSLDEAWIGLFAGRLNTRGLYTPHSMNHYTGALYAWLVSLSFRFRGISLEAMRLPGALFNAAAMIGLWAHLRRRVSPEAGAAFALLCAGSAYLLLKSRLAWEVYALHPLLILGTLAALAGDCGWTLAALTVVGVQNHFIYLVLPASLVVLFGARAAWRGEKEAEPRLVDAAGALTAGLAFALVKHSITDSAWQAHTPALGLALLLAPLAATAAVRRVPARILLLPFSHLRSLLALTASAFMVWHLVPMIQIFAGPVIFERLFSLRLPLLLSAGFHVWGVFLAALLVWYCVRAWHAPGFSFHERTLLLWPAAFASVFILMRHTSSLRYYSLPCLISLPALAVILPRLPDRKAVALAALAAAVVTQGYLWREVSAAADREPLKFHIGWRKESSSDFTRKEKLFAAFDASGSCGIGHSERSFTAIPLYFHRLEKPAPDCARSRDFDAPLSP